MLKPEPLLDWSDWERFRKTVKHPCLTIKQENLNNAYVNIKRYSWAQKYVLSVKRTINYYLPSITREFIDKMIEETTPGDSLWTPCPSCRDQKRTLHPHGLWSWDFKNPDSLKCCICDQIFPNKNYPEDIILRTSWNKPQLITYYSGEPFTIFSYQTCRPSFSGNVRSRKVQWMASFCYLLAEGYLLTGSFEYAIACRNILLRFAFCYPKWLVHVGYGEYADMDPCIASRYITSLPYPEVCPPPKKPNRSLWTGFWSAGRATGVGLESDFINKVVLSFDFTCVAVHPENGPIYSEDERIIIERDLLLESTILLVYDKQINNKSVSNRTAAALVGMCVGHPGLVRFGLEGFNKTVDGWFKPDGTASETPFYGLMTLCGIWGMAQSMLKYSDPPNYLDDSGKRIDSLDLYHNTPYHRIWDAFFKGLQGDFVYPPYADSFRNTKLDVSFVEIMVANYPERTEYFSLLKALCGQDLLMNSGSPELNNITFNSNSNIEPLGILPYNITKPLGYSSFSIFYRCPGLEKIYSPDLKLSNWCPPILRIGHLRTGKDGRESLLLMSASHWGIHHENDSLNLYYWKKGYEILSDLGYLWDHPLKHKNKQTVSHNTVLIDEKNQTELERGGDVMHFKIFENAKMMEMTSSAYPEASLYRRTSAIIDHGNGQNYVVDFFRIEGGGIQDYIFHCTCKTYNIFKIKLEQLTSIKLYDFYNIRTAKGNTIWRAVWKNGNMTCTAWNVGQKSEQVFITDGWGQRDWKNSDVNTRIPYIIRRTKGAGVKTFISVFEGYEEKDPFIRNVTLVNESGIICIETKLGRDYVMSMINNGVLNIKLGGICKSLSGHFAVASIQNNQIAWSHNINE